MTSYLEQARAMRAARRGADPLKREWDARIKAEQDALLMQAAHTYGTRTREEHMEALLAETYGMAY